MRLSVNQGLTDSAVKIELFKIQLYIFNLLQNMYISQLCSNDEVLCGMILVSFSTDLYVDISTFWHVSQILGVLFDFLLLLKGKSVMVTTYLNYIRLKLSDKVS